MNAPDTNVLLYSIDANEPVKQAKAQQLAERFSLSHWDSMILGACHAAGVDHL